ncbi:MAG: DUF2281 domain-containing protein [Nitrospirae bacterium]|nr:DUF2281 domain-containing protein [Nitrospirota bacterium]
MREIDLFSDDLIDEVIGFAQCLKSMNKQKALQCMMASEALLAKDWLTDVESKAWEDL